MITDWIASILELIGGWMKGNKNKYGFIVSFCSCCLWIFVAVNKSLYGLLFICVCAGAVNIRNFLKWRKKDETDIYCR